MGVSYVIWGSELSPFSLKVRAMCDYKGVEYLWAPAEGTFRQNFSAWRRVERIKSGRLPIDYPKIEELDEFPLLPYLLGGDGLDAYDSSAIAEWLDRRHPRPAPPLIPEEPGLEFVARLIDEYFDEFGLYMAHHNRWVVSAADNSAGQRVAEEFSFLAPGPLKKAFAAWFSARQVRRLPYLFSVAAPGFQAPGLTAARCPKARSGFPPTHELLNRAFKRMLAAVEEVLCERSYLLGNRFTVADASAYGQLCMNLHDPSAQRIIASTAPRTEKWLRRIEAGALRNERVPASERADEISWSDSLAPLIEEIGRTFVPLMEQNQAAYEKLYSGGQRLFNEAAFNRGQSLYEGELCGAPFRAVAKTFQVRIWRDLKAKWTSLDRQQRSRIPLLIAG